MQQSLAIGRDAALPFLCARPAGSCCKPPVACFNTTMPSQNYVLVRGYAYKAVHRYTRAVFVRKESYRLLKVLKVI